MPPDRFKTYNELSVDEYRRHKLTGKLPESDECVAERRRVLARAGLEDEPADAGQVDPHTATTAEFVARQRARRNR